MFVNTICSLIDALANCNGSNAKIQLLRENASNEYVRYFFAQLLTRTNRHISASRVEESCTSVDGRDITFDEFKRCITFLETTTNKRPEFLESLEDYSQDSIKLLCYVLRRKTPANIGDAGIRKALDIKKQANTINTYQRCALPTEKILKDFNFAEACVQLKYDGSYAEIGFLPSGVFGIRTRSNKYYPLTSAGLNIDESKFLRLYGKRYFMGEFIAYSHDMLDRPTSNGVMNSLLHAGELPLDKYIVFYIWDTLLQDLSDCNVQYKKRLDAVPNTVECCNFKTEKAETTQIYTYDDAVAYARAKINEGFEGAVLKDLNAFYQPGKTSKQQLKLKNLLVADLRIDALVKGDTSGKHSDTFGSVKCVTIDGALQVNVSGISDVERRNIFDNFSEYYGKTVEVQFNSVVQNGDKYSLFLPRFLTADGKIIIRDKPADTTQRILDMQYGQIAK